jgi:hypothetical protein
MDFKSLPTDQKVNIIQSYLIVPLVLLCFWNPWVGGGSILALNFSIRYAMTLRENALLRKHQGEKFFDTFTIVDPTLCQDIIYPTDGKAEELPLASPACLNLPFTKGYQQALIFYLKKEKIRRDPGEVLSWIQKEMTNINREFGIIPDPQPTPLTNSITPPPALANAPIPGLPAPSPDPPKDPSQEVLP